MPVSSYCISTGSMPNNCSTNGTIPNGYQQFCYNCKTNTNIFKQSCISCLDNYNKKRYFNKKIWKPNTCTVCSCVVGKTRCSYRVPKAAYLPWFRARCTNCNLQNFIKRFPCKSCKNVLKGNTYASGRSWWMNKCFICQCFGGRTFCRKEGFSKSIKNGVANIRFFPLCRSCGTYKLINYMRQYQCKICKDVHHELIRLHKEVFMIRFDISCKCYDGIIQCQKQLSQETANIFGIPTSFTVCRNCTAPDIKRLKERKGKQNALFYIIILCFNIHSKAYDAYCRLLYALPTLQRL